MAQYYHNILSMVRYLLRYLKKNIARVWVDYNPSLSGCAAEQLGHPGGCGTGCAAQTRHSVEVRHGRELRWNYCLPATTIRAISHMNFPSFDFSIVPYMSLLFQLQGQHGFLPTTRQQIMCAFTWNQALEAVHLNSPLLSSHSEINTPPLPWQLRAEKSSF